MRVSMSRQWIVDKLPIRTHLPRGHTLGPIRLKQTTPESLSVSVTLMDSVRVLTRHQALVTTPVLRHSERAWLGLVWGLKPPQAIGRLQ
jgi:hypothetical protein